MISNIVNNLSSCLIGLHPFSDWQYADLVDNVNVKMIRKCMHCGKTEYFTGKIHTNLLTGAMQPVLENHNQIVRV